MHFTTGKAGAVLQCAKRAANQVTRRIVSGPPMSHSIRRRNTRTLAATARVIDVLHFGLAQRAVENFYFVDLSIPEIGQPKPSESGRSDIVVITPGKIDRLRVSGRADAYAIYI